MNSFFKLNCRKSTNIKLAYIWEEDEDITVQDETCLVAHLFYRCTSIYLWTVF